MFSQLSELKGQESALKLLTKYLGSAPPAFLIFHGPRGVGKFSAAEVFINYFLCEEDRACGFCKGCILFKQGTHPDYIRFPEGKIKIGDSKNPEEFTIRWLQNTRLNFSPIQSKMRFVLFPEGQKFQHEAQTALLKTLEESQEHTHFIILIHDLYELKPTVISRAQMIPFRFLDNSCVQSITQMNEIEYLNILGGSLHNVSLLRSDLYKEMKQRIQQALLHPMGLFELERWLHSLESSKNIIKLVEGEVEYSEILNFFVITLLTLIQNIDKIDKKYKYYRAIFDFKKDLSLSMSGLSDYLLSLLFSEIYSITFE